MAVLGRWLALGFVAGAILCAGNSASRAGVLSSKRGFGDAGGAGYTNLQSTGSSWYFSWWTDPSPDTGGFDADFYPLLKLSYLYNTTTVNSMINAQNPKYMFGFNEPEVANQSNISASDAAAVWDNLYNPAHAAGITVVSPAVSDTGAGQAWLSSFMAVKGSHVDAVAFHWYGVNNPNDPAGAASTFLSRVDSYHSTYNKPVVIPEFAIHDWGGAYTDAQITEANRQFLDIVVPGLESRSYVLKYAFYPWFSDGQLWTGNPQRPSEMGYTYAGALAYGDSENLSGKSYGEHVAYLHGGDVTLTSAGATSLKYISALEATSSISGSADWSLASGGWVRIRPKTTLRKAGTNTITIASGTVTNDGSLEVMQGKLSVGTNVAGAGSMTVWGGTLEATANNVLDQSVSVKRGGTLQAQGAVVMHSTPLIDVRAGGTLDVSNRPNPLPVITGNALNVAQGGQVLGSVTGGGAGVVISGGGTFTGNLQAQSGSLVRVGRTGAGAATRFTVDNFESYSTGDVRDVASPPWTAHQDTSLADIETVSGTKALSFGYASGARGVSRTLPDDGVIDNNELATYFFRINSKTNDPDHNIGLGDKASVGTADFADFEAQLRCNVGTGSTFNLDARNGAAFTSTLKSGLALNTWYNVWMVVNQAADKYDIYVNTGTGAAAASDKINPTQLSFRNGTTDDLNQFLALANNAPVDNGVRVDDITFMTGQDLTNPMAGLNAGMLWTPETLTVGGTYTQTTGATLEINIKDPSKCDLLKVTGAAAFNGTLAVTLALGAATPLAGDAYHILDFASASGTFQTLSLPTLSPELRWDTTALLTTGDLKVIYLPGDFDHDGSVDGDDFLMWQRGESPDPNSATDLAAWQANYGTVPPAVGAAGSVPEPGGVGLMVICAVGFLMRRRRA